MNRGSRAAGANPNPGEQFSVATFSEIVLGLANSGLRWLKALKNSARNSNRLAAVTGKILKIEISPVLETWPANNVSTGISERAKDGIAGKCTRVEKCPWTTPVTAVDSQGNPTSQPVGVEGSMGAPNIGAWM
jgi:hypothetical protein